jgi:ParB-like chromosome segregation protein Spo0J
MRDADREPLPHAMVLTIPVSDVTVPEDRLRTLKPGQAEAIGHSIAAHGQLEPIAVTQLPGRADYVLVDGWHRLEGCRMAGLATVEARVVPVQADRRRRHEALSGLARATHDVFDRAAAIDALARLARSEAGLPEEGDLRRQPSIPSWDLKLIDAGSAEALAMIAKANRWDERLASELGLSARTVRLLRRVHLRIPQAIKARLKAVGAADELVSLDRLAGFSEADMLSVCELLESGKADGILAALQAIHDARGQAEIRPHEKAIHAFMRKTAGWTPQQRREFMAHWNQLYLPDGRPRGGGREG